jgi:hypothetical protein
MLTTLLIVPRGLRIGRAQPHENVFPDFKFDMATSFSAPQSQRHSQKERWFLERERETATSLQKRWPATSDTLAGACPG